MKIQWEKLPDRLQSEALKCMLCNIMKKHAEKHELVDGFTHCSVYMSYALATDDDEAFTKDAPTLLKSLDKYLRKDITDSIKKEVDTFLKANYDYIRARTKEVLERATECPDFKLKGE